MCSGHRVAFQKNVWHDTARVSASQQNLYNQPDKGRTKNVLKDNKSGRLAQKNENKTQQNKTWHLESEEPVFQSQNCHSFLSYVTLHKSLNVAKSPRPGV